MTGFWRSYIGQYSNLADFVDPVKFFPRWSKAVAFTGLSLDVLCPIIMVVNALTRTFASITVHKALFAPTMLIYSLVMVNFLHVAFLARRTVTFSRSFNILSAHLFYCSAFTTCSVSAYALLATNACFKSQYHFAVTIFLQYLGRAGNSLCNVSIFVGRTTFLVDEDNHIIEQIKKRNDRIIQLEKTFVEAEHKRALADAAAKLIFEEELGQKLLKKEKEFIASALHEIRNPINGIVGALSYVFGELAPMLELVPDIEQELHTIESCTNHLSTLLRSILTLDKILNGSLSLRKTRFEPARLVMDIEKIQRRTANKNTMVVCGHDGGEDGIALEGAPTQLSLVLLNLVSNAVKFTEMGMITVSWKKEEETEEVAVVRFSVMDTGVGIPKDEQESVFGFRNQSANEEIQSKGFGIGLSVASKLVNLMGGELKVRSPVREADGDGGVGCEFYFVLGLKKLNAEAPMTLKSTTKNLFRSFRVLVVDDDNVNRKITSRYFTSGKFKELCWTADVARTGEDALKMMETATEEGSYDLVILDENMEMAGGKLKGTETTVIIRERERGGGKRSLVFGLSGNCTKADMKKSWESGQDGFWSKPIPSYEKAVEDLTNAWTKMMECQDVEERKMLDGNVDGEINRRKISESEQRRYEGTKEEATLPGSVTT